MNIGVQHKNIYLTCLCTAGVLNIVLIHTHMNTELQYRSTPNSTFTMFLFSWYNHNHIPLTLILIESTFSFCGYPRTRYSSESFVIYPSLEACHHHRRHGLEWGRWNLHCHHPREKRTLEMWISLKTQDRKENVIALGI